MSLFDLEPLSIDEIRARTVLKADGPTVRKVSATGKVYTVRHQPWWKLIGKGPEGYTCGDCHWLKEREFAKTYFKCGRQIVTMGCGTDIRKSDGACRLFHIKGFEMFTIKDD